MIPVLENLNMMYHHIDVLFLSGSLSRKPSIKGEQQNSLYTQLRGPGEDVDPSSRDARLLNINSVLI